MDFGTTLSAKPQTLFDFSIPPVNVRFVHILDLAFYLLYFQSKVSGWTFLGKLSHRAGLESFSALFPRCTQHPLGACGVPGVPLPPEKPPSLDDNPPHNRCINVMLAQADYSLLCIAHAGPPSTVCAPALCLSFLLN